MVCEANGLTKDARRAYEQAVARDQGLPRAWYRLAIADGRTGDVDHALTAVDRVIALDSCTRRRSGGADSGCSKPAAVRMQQVAFEKATTLDPQTLAVGSVWLASRCNSSSPRELRRPSSDSCPIIRATATRFVCWERRISGSAVRTMRSMRWRWGRPASRTGRIPGATSWRSIVSGSRRT